MKFRIRKNYYLFLLAVLALGGFLFLGADKVYAAAAPCSTSGGGAGVCYVDTNSSGGDGTTQATSGAHAAFATIATVNGYTYTGDDQILFKKGDTWREQLTVPSSGTSGHPITFGAYGDSGAKPIISGSNLIIPGSNWAPETVLSTPTKVQSTIAAVGTTSATKSFVNTPASGNLMWAVCKSSTTLPANPVTSGSGANTWTKAVSAASGSGFIGIWYRVAASSEAKDVSCAVSGATTTYIAISEWTGTDASTPLDQVGHADSGSAVNSKTSGTTGLTTVASELLVAALGSPGVIDTQTPSFTNSFTDYLNLAVGYQAFVVDSVVASTGTKETTMSWTGAARFMSGTIATFKAMSALHVWSTPCTTEPKIVLFNGTPGTKVASEVALASSNQWYWASNVLYVYSTTDPDTAYTNPGIEVGARDYGIVDTAGHAYITIDGLNIVATNSYGIAHTYNPGGYAGNTPNWIVQNSNFTNTSINLHGASTTVQDNVFVGPSAPNPTTGMDGALLINGLVSTSPSVLRNTISGYFGRGVHFMYQVDSPTANDNIIHDITKSSGDQSYGIDFDGYGGNVTGTVTALRNTIYNTVYFGIFVENASDGSEISRNLIHDCNDAAIQIKNSGAEVGKDVKSKIHNNITYGLGRGAHLTDVKGVSIWNNTIITAAAYLISSIELDGTSANDANIDVRNNIFGSGPTYIVKVPSSSWKDNLSAFDYNFVPIATTIIHETGGPTDLTLAQLQAGGDASHCFSTDPLLISASDFHLQPTSPAINAGTTIAGLTSDYAGNSVPQGSAPDIGAYEFLTAGTAPTNLKQYQSNGTTEITSGNWTNNTTQVLKFQMASGNPSDSLTPQVEIQPVGTSFTNSVTNSGSAVAYSGSLVTGSVPITGLTPNASYHWQARTSNPVGQSSWTAYGGTDRDFGIDTDNPTTPGTPTTTTPTNNTTPAWTWTASNDPTSGLASTNPYTVQWSTDQTFNTGVNSGTSSTNSFTHSSALADGTWYFRVKAQDKAGNFSSYSSNGSVTIDSTPPTVTDVTSTTTNGAYKAGATVNVRVTFSKNVTITGAPRIKLQTNNGDKYAAYATGSGSQNIDFSYVVQSGDTTSDLDYVNTTALELNSGTIQDAAGNNATLTLPAPGASHSLSSNKNVVLDTTAPTLSETTPVPTPTKNQTPSYTFNSSEAGTISYGNGCSSGDTTAVSGPNIITFSTLSEGVHACTLQVTDAAGNASSPLPITGFTIDITPPSVSLTSPVTGDQVNSNHLITFTGNESNPQCSLSSFSGWIACVSGVTKLADLTGWNSLTDGLFSLFLKDTDLAGNTGNTSQANITKDTVAPTLSEVTPVTTPTKNQTPSYTFNSSEAGTITYGGDCSSGTAAAAANHNTITFHSLSESPHSNCTIRVTDQAGNISSVLNVTTFTVDLTSPALSEVTPVTSPTKNQTPSYTFNTTEAGTISYSGGCSSATTSATANHNTVTFTTLAQGTYSNCKIRVTDAAGNQSSQLSVSSFTIDITPPSLSEVTPVPAFTNNTAPSYTFHSSEAGTITYGGACSSSITNASAGDNTVTFNTLSEGAYSNCTIRVTDAAGNASLQFSVSAFTIDLTAPTLSNGAPNNQTFPVTTTSATLSLTTSETATCRYSTQANVSYGSLPNTFTTTNATSHSTLVTGLDIGTTYTYYIRCRDSAGNVTTSDYALTFSVAPSEENSLTLNSVKIKVERAINKFKDVIHIATSKFKLKGEDSNLANGTVKIYKGHSLIDTIVADAQGFWEKVIHFKNNSSHDVKVKMYDQNGTLLDTQKAKVVTDTRKPSFAGFPTYGQSYAPGTVIQWKASDNQKIDHYRIFFNGSITTRKTTGFLIPKNTKPGDYGFTVNAYDEAGNRTSKSVAVMVY